MRFFMLAASVRKDSYNKKNIRIAASIIGGLGDQADLQEYESFNAPMYDGDMESSTGIPDSIQNLSKLIGESDAVIISSPEYNGSIPGTLKNTLDWLSRLKPMTLAKKPVLLLGASPGALGAVRGNLHARTSFQILGCYLYPEYLGLAKAAEAFEKDGSFKDPEQKKKLEKILRDFKDYAEQFTK